MLSLTILGLALGANLVQAQPYPSRPIQLIIPNVPGSIMDINSRILSEELGKTSWHSDYSHEQTGCGNDLGYGCLGKEQKGRLYHWLRQLMRSRLCPDHSPGDDAV